MKILHIVEAFGGGVLTYLVGLANEQVKMNDVTIAYAIRQETPSHFIELFDERVHLINVVHFTRQINPVKDICAFFEIKHIADSILPDVIHLHSSKAGAIGRFAFNGKRTALFYTPHGYSFLMKNEAGWKRAAYKAIEFICGQRACTVISCSKGEHLETLKITNQACYINNGINIQELEEGLQTLSPTSHVFTVVTLGRICHQKNPALFNQIAAAMPEVKFLWIGGGEFRHVLSSPNIEITGWLDRKQAIEKTLNADVFLLTSLWEGLPMSLLEAMYLKKVCVVSNVIGNRDVIINEKNGFVCETLADYVNAIEKVRMGNAEGLAEDAYLDVLREYNTQIMAEKYIEEYKDGYKATRSSRRGKTIG